MPKNNLIDIKEKFSLAYLHAVAAKADITVSETPWSTDRLGIDLCLYRLNSATVNGSSFNNTVRVQLKGTSINTGMIKEEDDCFKYSLKKDLNSFPNMYFVLVILPSDEKGAVWLQQDENQIVMFKCAYFVKVDQILKKGTVVFPKMNILTPDALLNMFSLSKEEFLNEY